MTLFIVLLVWVIGAFIAYNSVFKDWEDNTKFEKIWFSIFWPAMIILYIVKVIYRSF